MSQTNTATETQAVETKPQVQTTETQVTPKVQEVKAEVVKPEEDDQPDPMLVSILATKRAHGSTGDTNFRTWLFGYIKSTLKLKPEIKIEGNIYVTTDPKSTVLFSCHVDTVHSPKESDGSKQKLGYDAAFGHIFLAPGEKSSCLGADDGLGIYIMLQMLKNGVKGHYMFHTGEECGGIGSRAFVAKEHKFLESLEVVVAFDRKVTDGENPEVIITQGGQRCASEEFGKALAAALNKAADFDLPYIISRKGTFTDSKVYSSTVPECVNLGCFYEHQHTNKEYVQWPGVKKLVQAAIAVDWAALPIFRDPREDNKPVTQGYYGPFTGLGSSKANTQTAATKGHAWQVNTKKSKPSHGADLFPFRDEEFTSRESSQSRSSLLEAVMNYSADDIDYLIADSGADASNVLMRLVIKVKGLEAENKGLKKLLDI